MSSPYSPTKKKRLWLCLAILLLLLVVSITSRADSPVRLFSEDHQPLNLHMYLLEDKKNALTIDQVTSAEYASRFIKNEQPQPNMGITSSTYWIRITLQYPATYPNTEPEKLWYLEIAKSLLNVAELYIREIDGSYKINTSDLRTDWEHRQFRHVYSVFPFTTYLGEELTLYLKLENKTSLRIPLVLWSQEGFTEKTASEEFAYGFFFGGMVIMMIYNLFVYFSVKDVGYLYYVAYLAGVSYFEMLEVGHGAIHVDALFQVFGKEFIPFVVLFSLVSGILFARSFLETVKLYPKLDIIFRLLLWTVQASLFINFMVPFAESVLWITTISSIVLSYMLIASAYAWLRGSESAKFFFFAWLFNAFGFITYSLMVNQILPTNVVTIMSAPFGVFFEAVILSFALANRIKRAQKSALESDEEAMNHLAKYRSVFNNSQEGMYQMTMSGNINSANPAMANIMEMSSADEVLSNGKALFSVLFGDNKSQIFELCEKGNIANELKLATKSGENKWIHHRAHITFNEEGKATHIKGVVIDVTEVKEKESAIKKGLKERSDRDIATAAATEKSRFLSMMSHEIRTPLAAIIGYSETLQEGGVEQADKRHYINVIVNSSQRLLKLTNNILDLSKLEANKFDIESIEVDIVKILQDITSDFSKKAKKRNLYFDVIIDTKIPSVIQSDPTRLHQVLNNICENSINFTKEGGVKLVVSWNSDNMSFTIIDTGIGISKSAAQGLFDLSNINEGNDDSLIKGAGLGLPISKHFAILMGGDITYKHGKNVGSEFKFDINAVIGHKPEWIESISPALPQNIGRNIDSNINRNVNNNAINKQDDVAPTLEGTVLLAEDNLVNQTLIQRILEKAGITVVIAKNGVEACNYCDKKLPDLILMDINMPVRNGIEATTYLREKHYQTPIFALTAETDQAEINAALAAGCQGVLSKPINRREVFATLTRYLTNANNKNTSLTIVKKRPPISQGEDIQQKIATDINCFSDELPQIGDFMQDLIKQKQWGKLKELADQIGEVATSCQLTSLTQHCHCLSQALTLEKKDEVSKWIPIVEKDLITVVAMKKSKHRNRKFTRK